MRGLVIIILSYFICFNSFSNEIVAENSDSMFYKARELAFSGKRQEARELCDQIIEKSPTYVDAYVLIGRTFAWDKKYPQAKIALKKAIGLKPSYFDPADAISDVYTWEGKTDSAIFYCNYALSFKEKDPRLLLKRANLYFKINDYDRALWSIEYLLNVEPENEEAKDLLRKIKIVDLTYKVGLDHNFQYFKSPYIRNWHMTSLFLSKRAKNMSKWTRMGSVIGRINIGDLIKDGESFYSKDLGYQFEIDAYPKLSKGLYSYISYGFSPTSYFPRHRAGIEFYQKLPLSFETSLGARYMQFISSTDSTKKHIAIFTGSIGKYLGNYWFSFRPFITPKQYELSQSYNLEARKYFSNAETYLYLMLGTGNSPDEPENYVSDADIYRMNSQKLKIGIQGLFKDRFLINFRVGYEYEEYKEANFREVYNAKIKLAYYL